MQAWVDKTAECLEIVAQMVVTPAVPPGYRGEGCQQVCESTKLGIARCTNPLFDCSLWIDGNGKSSTGIQCPQGEGNCFAVNYDFDLAQRYFVDRIRFMSDWWAKRPGAWDLLASDDSVKYSLVMSARSNHAPWGCVQGEPCTAAVPEECCPGGVTQDTSSVGAWYAKWDDFRFTGVVAQYWRLRINTTDDPRSLVMAELELFGNGCLGSQCDVPTCTPGVCTEEGPASCACTDCQPEAACTSAFVGAVPGCTTPEF
ncbi:MAG: hypothetical protein MUF54_13840 [Polyangiaceae bacterium]|jgi:hypothetical protein|nr:hypothetical protein [Polyangiaceae bacterium]